MTLAMPRPPLRAVLLILIGWIGVRAWALWPDGGPGALPPPPPVAVASLPRAVARSAGPALSNDRGPAPAAVTFSPSIPHPGLAAREVARAESVRPAEAGGMRAPPNVAPPMPVTPGSASPSATGQVTIADTPPAGAPASRLWSGWAYLFYRPGGGRTLAAGGQLGGSQAAARLAYRIDDVFAIAGRAYAPLSGRGAEAAGGIDARLGPIHAVVERRVAIDRQGRNAWSAYLTGGVYREIGPLAVDGYAQAGVVGARRRDGFVDGAARAGVRIGRNGPIVGAGAWGAAQPGARRIDLGPRVAWTEPHTRLTASIDGRFRVAGRARPGSGVALTLGRDF